MDINIQPKQSSMSASTVSAMITLTTEEIVVNTSTNAADDYTLSQYKEAQKKLEEMLSDARDVAALVAGWWILGRIKMRINETLSTMTAWGQTVRVWDMDWRVVA